MVNPPTGAPEGAGGAAGAGLLPSWALVRGAVGVPFTPFAVATEEACIWLDGRAASATELVGRDEAKFCKLPDGWTPLAGNFLVPGGVAPF